MSRSCLPSFLLCYYIGQCSLKDQIVNCTIPLTLLWMLLCWQTLLCDINAMTSDAPNWTLEDKLSLESQLLLHTSEPLCLDPSPGVFLASARLNYEKHKLNTNAFRRLFTIQCMFYYALTSHKTKAFLLSGPRAWNYPKIAIYILCEPILNRK